MTEECRGSLRFTVPLCPAVLCVHVSLAESVVTGRFLKVTVEEKDMNTTKYELNASFPAVKISVALFACKDGGGGAWYFVGRVTPVRHRLIAKRIQCPLCSASLNNLVLTVRTSRTLDIELL